MERVVTATEARLERQQEQADWRTLVQQARARIRAELGERELPPPEEIIQQMREERDAQLPE